MKSLTNSAAQEGDTRKRKQCNSANPKNTSRELGHSTTVFPDIKSGGLKMAVRVTVRQHYQPSRAPRSWTQSVGLCCKHRSSRTRHHSTYALVMVAEHATLAIKESVTNKPVYPNDSHICARTESGPEDEVPNSMATFPDGIVFYSNFNWMEGTTKGTNF